MYLILDGPLWRSSTVKILVTGPKGYVGSAALCKLIERGHEVTALVRPGEPLPEDDDEGLTWRHGALESPASIADLMTRHDGLAHMAASADPSFDEINERFVREMLEAMSPDQAFVMQAGSLTFGDSGAGLHSASSPYRPPPALERRAALERFVRESGAGMAAPRSFVVYGALVYGGAGGAVPNVLLNAAKAHGSSAFVGEGTQRWSPVHLEDWVDLMVLATERGPRGGRAYFAAGEPAISMVDLARLVGRALSVPNQSLSMEEAVQRFGSFGAALATQQRLNEQGARLDLGWVPEQTSVSDWFSLRWPGRNPPRNEP